MKFRTEALYGEGYRNAAEVMAHETFELCNSDIADTLSDTILKGTPMGKRLEKLSALLDCNYDDEELETDEELCILNEIAENYQEDETEGVKFFKNVLQAVKEVTGKDIKYCLWLCPTRQDVLNYDIHDEIELEDIDAYEESDIILSDIGSEGCLYGYEEEPKLVEPVTFRMYARVKFNRVIDKDEDCISCGGYGFTMNGEKINFDFEEFYGTIDEDEDGDVLEIECKNPDYDTFSDLSIVTKEMLSNVSSINEFVIDIDDDEDEESLYPIELLECCFYLPYEDFEEIKISEDVIKNTEVFSRPD